MKTKILDNGYAYMGIAHSKADGKIQNDLDIGELEIYIKDHGEDRKTYHYFNVEKHEVGFFLPLTKTLVIFRVPIMRIGKDNMKGLRKMFESNNQDILNDPAEMFID